MGKKRRKPQSETLIIFLSLLMVIITPMASDSYTPSLPAMTKAFGTSSDAMQLTMTTYLLGVSISQLIYGPLSDRHGRKPIILIGISIAVVGSLLCAIGSSLFFILFARFIQGWGAGVCNGLFRALMRDQFSGPRMSQVGSYAGMMYTIAFAGAPVLGGYIQAFFGWRANFIFVALVVFIILITLWSMLPETHLKKDKHATKFKNILRNYTSLILSPSFLGYTAMSSAAYAGFVAYYTAGPFILEMEVGLKPEQFGLLSLGIAIGLFLGMFVNVRLVVTKGISFLLLVGLILMLLSGCAMLIVGLLGILNTIAVILPVILFATATAFVFTNAMTLAFQEVGHIAGVAGGMYGFIQILGAAFTSLIVAKLSETTQVPLASILTGLSVFSIILYFLIHKHTRKKS